MEKKLKYKRICLKITGEILGKRGEGLSWKKIQAAAKQLLEIYQLGVDLVIVIGGGNWFRGRQVSSWSLDPAVADYIGMLATIMNGLALQEALEALGVDTRLMSAIDIPKVAEPYMRRKALNHLKKRRIVILAAGVGAPFFTTDTAAALRALELRCEVFLKGSNVDGIYDCDPKKYKKAKKYERIDFEEAIRKNLQVMDGTAFAMCREKKLPIVVFNLSKKGTVKKILLGRKEGTLVH